MSLYNVFYILIKFKIVTMRNLILYISIFCCLTSFTKIDKSVKLYYVTNGFNLSTEHKADIKEFLSTIKSVNVKSISITGFADYKGTDEFNINLSSQRAKAVYSFIKSEINDSLLQISYVGKGEIKCERADAQSLRNARRVDVAVVCRKCLVNKELDEEISKTSLSKILNGRLKKGEKIVFDNVYFQGGRHSVLSKSYVALNQLAYVLKRRNNYNILIEGHICCETSSVDGLDRETGEYNLSSARAKFVRDYLINEGVDSVRIKHVGLGNRYPTGKGDRADRRVEIKIL